MLDQTHIVFYLLVALGLFVCICAHRKGVERGAEECIQVLLEIGIIEQHTDDEGEVQLTPGGECEEDENINRTCPRCGFYGGFQSGQEECEDQEEGPS